MKNSMNITRREFLATTGAVGASALFTRRALAGTPLSKDADMLALRHAMKESPVGVALHRAKVFTKVFQQHEAEPWIVRKAMALREYFETVPLYLREHDGIAGSISETPGAMPVMVELAIGEINIYLSERPDRAGYLKGKVPDDIRDYWKNRNMWGRYRTEILGQPPVKSHDELPLNCPHYKLLSNQGHLCPSYTELLRVGIGGLRKKVAARRQNESNADKLAFLTAAEHTLTGLSAWAQRYGKFLAAEGKQEMSRICGKIATQPPETFREALQLVWLAHQAIHIEGHGYSCTPDRLDQLLLPFYEADMKAGRLDDVTVVQLTENFVLKMFDNTYWGPEHHLTQGFVVGGSTPDGRDMTNRLSWLMMEGATNMALPEPLVWMRWHPAIDQKFFDFCLTRLQRTTCFPMLWNDKVVPEGLMELGVSREDAFNYVPVGRNELGVPGQFYFNPGAHVGYLTAIEAALTSGKGYKKQWKWHNIAPAVNELKSFDQFAGAVGAYMREEIKKSYGFEMKLLKAQMQWGQTPLTSCFFDGCVEKARDLTQGTKYNILSCGGTAFANAVDSMAAVREIVYEKKLATLDEVAVACAANFQGHERLRAKLRGAPKHGNDDPRADDIIRLVERLRDEPMKAICRDPRDGSKFGNTHVVRSGAVTMGRGTPATPDGRLAGTPVANSVAVSAGCERNGPTATLNSVCKLNAAKSWQCAYQVNIRFHAGMIADEGQRGKLRAMLNVYFQNGGQELQINVVDSATMRAAQKNPDQYRDLVVRVAGFSEFFVNLTPDMQEEIIARTEHM
ncbi:MAG: pyruvate formate lyase family protein [Verrucomicrobiia bacterium]